jgi:TonB family protein
MIPFIIVLAIGLFSVPYQLSKPFENRAISRVRQLNVTELDSDLRERSFAAWVRQLVGPRAGITWQLTECGEPTATPGSRGDIQSDIWACVEMSAILPDERKVVVLTRVGSFKRGLNGEPKFQFAMVESNGDIFEVMRLRDLPQMLRKPLLRSSEKRSYSPPSVALVLPVTSSTYQLPVESKPFPSRVLLDVPLLIITSVEPPVPAIVQPMKVSESVLLGSVLTRVLPEYPKFADQNRVSGEVKIDVTIDSNGRVIAAQAISGPFLLRSPVEEAIRKWVFKPTLLNKAPVSIRGIMTFNFKKP